MGDDRTVRVSPERNLERSSVDRRSLWSRSISSSCLRRARPGQSMVEYLIAATAVIAAIMFFKAPVQTAMNNLYGEATNQATNAAFQLQTLQGGGVTVAGSNCPCAIYWWCC